MQAYIAKRCLLFIPTLLLATLLAFLLLRVIPGDPALVKLAGETGDASFTQAELHDLQAKLGTDKPLYVQYGKWVWGLLRLDFGESMYFEDPVAQDLADKFPITLELTVLAMLIATIIAVPLGLVSAIKQDTPADYIARIISITGVALPNFWVGILIVYFLVLFFAWMPPLGYANLWDDPVTNLQQFIFPALSPSPSAMASLNISAAQPPKPTTQGFSAFAACPKSRPPSSWSLRAFVPGRSR